VVEKRRDYLNIESKLDVLTDVVLRIDKQLNGNGQRGFIRETDTHLDKIDQWIAAQVAIHNQRESTFKRTLAIWGTVIAAISIAANLAVAYFGV